MPRALITGITGQDGAYLAQHLLELGYHVMGAARRASSLRLDRLDYLGIANDVEIVPLEMLEFSNICRVLERTGPDHIYNLAAQSFVTTSFEQPLYTADVNAMGVLRLLEAIRAVNPEIRFYQASTSEMFGQVRETPQRETTPFHPRSPYAVAKCCAHWATVNYREAHGLHAVCGILFNHESPLRGEEFVTRKITQGLAMIRAGRLDCLRLGNLDAKRDWGFAGDYVKAMHAMLHYDIESDFVVSTGKTHSIREFATWAAAAATVDLSWEGRGSDERAIDKGTGRAVICVDPAHHRPAEVDLLVGDATLAQQALRWQPAVEAPDLAAMMMQADLERVS